MSVEMSGVVVAETLVVASGEVNATSETLSTVATPCDYHDRMLNYYPRVIQEIMEFQAIIRSECPEIELLHLHKGNVLQDAYLLTMGEARISQWEQSLGLTVSEGATLDNRRDNIIARIRGQGKLNTALINSIVSAFTGGTANSKVENGTLYVEITPPPNNKEYKFTDIEKELRVKLPAHLELNVVRNYAEWDEINSKFGTWNNVKSSFGTWKDVHMYIDS